MSEQSEKWTKLVEYINSKNIGDIICRCEIVNQKDYGKNTNMDNYRLFLTHCKYLESTGRGIYRVLKHINPKLSSGDVKKMAYNEEYRINNERYEKLNDILQ